MNRRPRFDRYAVVFVTIAVVLSIFAPFVAGPVAANSAASTTPHVVVSTGDEQPGELSITYTVGGGGSFSIHFTDEQLARIDLDNASTSGLQRVGENRYRGGGAAEITYTYSTETISDLGNVSVDQGSWAGVAVGRVVPRIEGTGSGEPTFEVEGPGTIRGGFAYLGEYETYSREGRDETFHLVVPEKAVLLASPETILDELEETSQTLRIRGRSGDIHAFALPTRGIQTRYTGVALGSGAVVVRDDAAATTSGDTWVHEYVHTRQEFHTGSRIQWFREASATYYAGYHLLNQHRVSFDWFRGSVGKAELSEDTLSDPASWSSDYVPYYKGSRVLAHLDTRIRNVTDGDRTLADVFRRLNAENDDRITAPEFYRHVADVADQRVAEEVRMYATTSQVPSSPDDPHEFTEGGDNDPDEDGLPNSVELGIGTNPFVVDSDGDGLNDSREHREVGTNATVRDTDSDGRPDATELGLPRSDPLNDDTDGDGIDDRREVVRGTDPTVVDTDGDALDDAREHSIGSDPLWSDTDGDGATDGSEVAAGTDPTATDSDGDGLVDTKEERRGTDPTASDTDGDGYADLDELALDLDPTSSTGWLSYYSAYVGRVLP